MRKTVTAVLLAAGFLAAAVPVLTVTNGQPDGNVTLCRPAIQPIPSMPGFVSVCSGSALSADVFLTAAHCFDPPSRPSSRSNQARRSACRRLHARDIPPRPELVP